MARTGKIARLPLAVREELNHRLRENESGQTLITWLNELEPVRAVLKSQFEGEPINDANLSNWRIGGFADWLKDQDAVKRIEKLGELSVRLANAAGGRMSKGFLAVAVGKIHEALEDGENVEIGEDGKAVVTGVGIDKLAKALASIAKIEQDDERLKLDQDKLDLERSKFRRTTAELFIDYVENEQARQIALGAETKDTKVAQLIQLWFGEMPADIGPAEFRKPKGADAAK